MALDRNTDLDLSLNGGWINANNQAVTLASYDLAITSGTPQNGDTIGLTYDTVYTIKASLFNRSTSDDIITRKLCNRNKPADVSIPMSEQAILYFGDSGNYIALVLKDGKLCLDSGSTLYLDIQTGPVSVEVDQGLETATLYFEAGDTDVEAEGDYLTLHIQDYTVETIQGDAHFNLLQGPLVTSRNTYDIKVYVTDTTVTMKVSTDGGYSYTRYTTTLNQNFEGYLAGFVGRTNEASRALIDGTVNISKLVIYKDNKEHYKILTNEYEGDYGDAIITNLHNVVNKQYVGELGLLNTDENSTILGAINEVADKYADLTEAGSFVNAGINSSMLSGQTNDEGNSNVINLTLTDKHEYIVPSIQCCYVSANTNINLELVGGGGTTYETYGTDDVYKDTEAGWYYWHEGGSGGYFKGTFRATEAGMLKIVTPDSGANTTNGDGGDAIITFTASGDNEIEVARAGGGKSGKPSPLGRFDVEVAGGKVTYNTDFITNVEIAEEGTTGKVWKKEYVG